MTLYGLPDRELRWISAAKIQKWDIKLRQIDHIQPSKSQILILLEIHPELRNIKLEKRPYTEVSYR